MPPRPPRRVPVESGIGPASRELTVRQTDAFTPFTAEGASGGMEQLARSLSGFSRDLEALYGDRQKHAQIRDQELGRQAYLEAQASQKDFVALQREGVVRPDENPWRRMGWQLSAGADSAMRYHADLTVAAAEGLKDATSMDEVREFERSFRNTWVDGNVPEDAQTEAFLNGFNPSLIATLSAFNEEWARKVTEGFVAAERDALGREVSGRLNVALEQGYDMETIGAELTDVADRAFAGGQNPKATETVVDAVLAYAESIDSYALLDALKSMEGGQPGDRWKVYDTPKFKDKIDEVEDRIAGDIVRKDNLRDTERKASWEESYRPLEDRLNAELAENLENPHLVDINAYVVEATEEGLPSQYIESLRSVYRAAVTPAEKGNELKTDYYFRQIVDEERDDFRELRRRISSDLDLDSGQRAWLMRAMETDSGGARRVLRALESDINSDLRLIWKPELVADFDRGASLVNAREWVNMQLYSWLGMAEGEIETNDPALIAQKHRLYREAIIRFWPPRDTRNRQLALNSLAGGTTDLIGGAGESATTSPFTQPIMRREEAAELLEDLTGTLEAMRTDPNARLSDEFISRMDDLALDQYPEVEGVADKLDLYERILRAQSRIGTGPQRHIR